MLLHRWFALASAFALQASASLIKRDINVQGCSAQQWRTIGQALPSLVDILFAARQRMGGLMRWWKNPTPIATGPDENPFLPSTIFTWQALYDPSIYFDMKRPMSDREDQLKVMQSVYYIIGNLTLNLSEHKLENVPPVADAQRHVSSRWKPQIQFWCGDDWLTETDHFGRRPTDDPGADDTETIFWDNRPDEFLQGADERPWLRLPNGKFERQAQALAAHQEGSPKGKQRAQEVKFDARVTIGYAFSGMPWPYRNVIAMNPNKFSDWDSKPLGIPNYDSILHGYVGPANQVHIDSLITNFLDIDMVQLVGRLPQLTGGAELGDELCPENKEWQGHLRVSRWKCATELALYAPEKTLQSINTFKYFILAMYLNSMDWSTGVGRPLSDARPPAEQTGK